MTEQTRIQFLRVFSKVSITTAKLMTSRDSLHRNVMKTNFEAECEAIQLGSALSD